MSNVRSLIERMGVRSPLHCSRLDYLKVQLAAFPRFTGAPPGSFFIPGNLITVTQQIRGPRVNKFNLQTVHCPPHGMFIQQSVKRRIIPRLSPLFLCSVYSRAPIIRPSQRVDSHLFAVHNPIRIIPEKTYSSITRERDELRIRLEKLKMDISTFQKNAALQLAKVNANLQNQILKNFIPVLRQLEMAKTFDFQQVNRKTPVDFLPNLQKNLQMVYEALLGATGLTTIVPHLGDPFDSTTQSALGLLYALGQPPNSVAHVVWQGYSYKGEIIHPAEVILSTENPTHPHLLPKDPRPQQDRKTAWRARLQHFLRIRPRGH